MAARRTPGSAPPGCQRQLELHEACLGSTNDRTFTGRGQAVLVRAGQIMTKGYGEYTIIQPEDFTFTAPSAGDPRRGVMRLSTLLEHYRGNIWRMPPRCRGRRHREASQEEIFVTLAGTTTLILGDPEIEVEIPQGAVAIVKPGTAVQLARTNDADAIVLVVGGPPTVSDPEYLPDARERPGARR
jgi:quercetin dioxygenase-like cupin family protein